MYEAQQPKEWDYILRDSEASLLFCANQTILASATSFSGGGAPPALRDAVVFDTEPTAVNSFAHLLREGEQRPAAAPALVQPGDTANLIYTSGTTGKPKGVVLSHDNIMSNLRALHQLFGSHISPADRSASFLPWAHVYAQTVELHFLLSAGASLALSHQSTLPADLQAARPTILVAVPKVFSKVHAGIVAAAEAGGPLQRAAMSLARAAARERREMLDRSDGRISAVTVAKYNLADALVFSRVKARLGGRLRFALTGGAALARGVQEFFGDMGVPIFEGYGLTETSPLVATERFGLTERLQGGLRCVPGAELLVCGADGESLPDGAEGEVVAVGPGVMQGYYRDPAATAAAVFERRGRRHFRTGDAGRLDRGVLTITGRLKEQFKLDNGKFVSPGPLEEAFQACRLVQTALLHGRDRPHCVALVVPDPEACRAWAAGAGADVGDGSRAAHARSAALRAAVAAGLEAAGRAAGAKGFELPRRTALLAEEFSVANGLLTPKLSVRRAAVAERYRGLIDSLYADSEPAAAAAA
jgi:long-chain acyl-CoA synthetase